MEGGQKDSWNCDQYKTHFGGGDDLQQDGPLTLSGCKPTWTKVAQDRNKWQNLREASSGRNWLANKDKITTIKMMHGGNIGEIKW